jgi:hypothetical protein
MIIKVLPLEEETQIKLLCKVQIIKTLVVIREVNQFKRKAYMVVLEKLRIANRKNTLQMKHLNYKISFC